MPLYVKSYTIPNFCEQNLKIGLNTMMIKMNVFLKRKQDLNWTKKLAI